MIKIRNKLKKDNLRYSTSCQNICIAIIGFLVKIYFFMIAPIRSKTKIIKLEKDKKTIWLVGLSHIANEKYYKAIKDKFSEDYFKDSLVLYEGVIDKEDKMKNPKAVINRLLDISKKFYDTQPKAHELFIGDIQEGDCSFEDLSEDTQQFLTTEDLNIFIKLDLNNILREILYNRNEVLLKKLTENYNKYNTFVIPWGDAHISGICVALLDQGFFVANTSYLRPFLFFRNIKALLNFHDVILI